MGMVVLTGLEQPVSSCGVSAGEGDVAHAVSKATKQTLACVAFPSQKKILKKSPMVFHLPEGSTACPQPREKQKYDPGPYNTARRPLAGSP